MTYKKEIQAVILSEMSGQIQKQGYCLHSAFIDMIVRKYGFSLTSVIGVLSRTYTQAGFIKRRANSDIKRVYHLNVSGCPIIYLKKE